MTPWYILKTYHCGLAVARFWWHLTLAQSDMLNVDRDALRQHHARTLNYRDYRRIYGA